MFRHTTDVRLLIEQAVDYAFSFVPGSSRNITMFTLVSSAVRCMTNFRWNFPLIHGPPGLRRPVSYGGMWAVWLTINSSSVFPTHRSNNKMESKIPLLWSPYRIGQAIIFSSCGFFLLSIFHLSFFPRLISAAAHWMSTYFDTWCGLSANLEFFAVSGSLQIQGTKMMQKIAIWAPSQFVRLHLRN